MERPLAPRQRPADDHGRDASPQSLWTGGFQPDAELSWRVVTHGRGFMFFHFFTQPAKSNTGPSYHGENGPASREIWDVEA